MNGTRDDDLDGVIAQVEAALDALEIVDPTSREMVLDGVRDALSDDPARPKVQVYEGGGEDEGRRGPPPDLRIIPPEREGSADVKVKVLHGGATRHVGGRIELPGEGLHPEWQTIVHGRSLRLYRIHCDDGSLQIAADSELIAQVVGGQTIDVEARVIRVGAGAPGRCVGSFSVV